MDDTTIHKEASSNDARSPTQAQSLEEAHAQHISDMDLESIRHHLSESPGREHISFHSVLAKAQEARDFALIRRLLAAAEPLLPDRPFLKQWYTHALGYLALEADHQMERAASYQESLLAERSALDPELLGRVLMELGMIYERLDRWDKALRCYEDCSTLYEAQNNHAALAVTLCNLAILHYKAQNHASAIECAQRSIALLEHSPDSSWKQQVLCAVWSQLGETYLRQGKLAEAEEALQRSVAVCQRSNRHFCQGVPYDNLGHVYRLLGQYEKAEAYYRMARQISNELGNVRDAAEATFGLGLLRMQSSQEPQEALLLFSQALKMADDSNNHELSIQIRLRQADIYERMGDAGAALSETERAVAIIESIRANIALPDDRARMTAARVEAYEQAVGRLYRAYQTSAKHNGQAKKIARAFRYAEMSKSRAFIEMLAGRPVRPPENVPQSWLDAQTELRQALHALYQDRRANAARINELETQLNRLRERIRLRAAEFESFNTVNPLTLEEVQTHLPDDAALLEYFASGDDLLAFVITARDAHMTALPLKLHELQRAFVQVDGRFGHVHGVMPDPHRRLSQPWILNKLYQRLIEPLGEVVTSARTLCIVPHGMLHYIPFHALYRRSDTDGSTHFLAFHPGGEPRAIIYAPSATALLDHCQRKPISGQKGCLALGYNSASLMHAEAEAQSVADITQGVCKLGAQATRNMLLNEGAGYRYVHLACHGWFNVAWPMASALAMADGELDVADVLQHLRLEAELVSLSACETGRSHVIRGDELIGLTRAFLYAGTPSVAVSQWLLDDLSSRIFITHFYRSLMQHGDWLKAEALGEAQRFVRNLSLDELREILRAQGVEPADAEWQLRALAHAAGHDDFNRLRGSARLLEHPYYWAALFLIGDRF